VFIAKLYGIHINQCSIITINPDYIRKENLDVNTAFIQKRTTSMVMSMQTEIEREYMTFQTLSTLKSPPKTDIGEHCKRPFECVAISQCWKHVESPSIFEISGIPRRTKYELYRKGITDTQDLSQHLTLTDHQRLQISSEKTGKTHLNATKITHFLDHIHYPLFYLDFEAVQPPIPLFENTHPFQSIPFQYSLHSQNVMGEPPNHIEVLIDPGIDPRESIAKSLIENIPEHACIMAFDASFERITFQALIDLFPQYADGLSKRLANITDLAIPFNNFDIYNKGMKGRRSIKYILSAFVDNLSYSELAISNGEKASKAYLKMMMDQDKTIREDLREQLLAYCHLDTYAMVKLLEKLIDLTGYKQ